MLCTRRYRPQRLLLEAGAAVVLAEPRGERRVAAASSEEAEPLSCFSGRTTRPCWKASAPAGLSLKLIWLAWPRSWPWSPELLRVPLGRGAADAANQVIGRELLRRARRVRRGDLRIGEACDVATHRVLE